MVTIVVVVAVAAAAVPMSTLTRVAAEPLSYRAQPICSR